MPESKLTGHLKKQSFQPAFTALFTNPFYFIRSGLYRHIRALAPQLHGKLLDFGCGRKPFEELFTVQEYIGVDMEQTGHDHSNSKVDVFYDGKHLPFENESFDAFFCSEVLEHVFDPDEVLPEANRVLKPGARALFTVPFCWNEHEVPYDYGRYSSFGLKHLLNKHGFTVIEMRKSGHFTEVIFQLWALYFFELFKRFGRKGHVISLLFIIPINLAGKVFLRIFPRNDSLYFNNIVLAEKNSLLPRYMMRKATIAYFILTMALVYIIAPWFFEKKLLFNELLSATGFSLLLVKRFRMGNDPVSICMILLLTWCGIHAITSLARMDSVYFYLRNTVIMYSMFGFFIGFYLLKYLGSYINKIRLLLRAFIGLFLLIPLPRLFFERFGVAMLFPALFKNASRKWIGLLLIAINLLYGISYKSFTSMLVCGFFILLFISPGYRFFIQSVTFLLVLFIAFFLYINPNLSLISHNFAFHTDNPIYNVMRSHPVLNIDGNSTWRLVLWNQLLVDDFPGNIGGLGFGTPALKYYPVEDYNKLHTLPYVLGGHNSYIYLFARLGIVYLLLMVYIYAVVFKEYFYHRAYYFANNQALVFWSFFTISVIGLFNAVLESPIYASAYWMLLGFTARAIYNRRNIPRPT